MSKTTTEMTAQLRQRAHALLAEELSLQGFAGELFRAAQTEAVRFAALVWVLGEEQQLKVTVEFGIRSLLGGDSMLVDERHLGLVRECFRRATPMRCAMVLDSRGEKEGTIVLLPLLRLGKTVGIIEVIPAPETTPQDYDPLVFELAAAISAHFQRVVQKAPAQDTAEFWKEFDRFVGLLYGSLESKDVAAIATTDGRTLLGCDRVSLLHVYAHSVRVAAVSHVESIQRRGKHLRLLARLGKTVARGNRPLRFEGDDLSRLDEVSEELGDYVEESRVKAIAVIPLYPSTYRRRFRDAISDLKTIPPRPCGLLVMEQFKESRFGTQSLQRVELLSEHLGASLCNAQRYEAVVWLPLWRMLSDLRAWFRGRRVAATLAILACLAVLAAVLAFVKMPYRVTAEGLAMPKVQYEVFAPDDGTVVDVVVESGQRVSRGDPLLVLENDKIRADLIAVENEVREKQELIAALGVEMESAMQRDLRDKALEYQGELTTTRVELAGAEARLAVLKGQAERLTVRAVGDGIVATFQLTQRLLHRPVTKGELLVEVMDDHGPWRLEIEIPEYRMGHVLAAYRERGPLRITYVAMARVDQKYEAVLEEIATRSNASDDGTIVQAFASIAPGEPPDRRVGTEVTAKIECLDRSIFYCLCGDLIEFIQRKLWF